MGDTFGSLIGGYTDLLLLIGSRMFNTNKVRYILSKIRDELTGGEPDPAIDQAVVRITNFLENLGQEDQFEGVAYYCDFYSANKMEDVFLLMRSLVKEIGEIEEDSMEIFITVRRNQLESFQMDAEEIFRERLYGVPMLPAAGEENAIGEADEGMMSWGCAVAVFVAAVAAIMGFMVFKW